MQAVNSYPARLRYHPDAYRFLFTALRWTQQQLGRENAVGNSADRPDARGSELHAHVSGQELVEGIRQYAVQQFGLMAKTVFRCWGVTSTDDFGHMVFELIERGELSKTDSDRFQDFCGQYNFDEAFDRDYKVATSHLFKD